MSIDLKLYIEFTFLCYYKSAFQNKYIKMNYSSFNTNGSFNTKDLSTTNKKTNTNHYIGLFLSIFNNIGLIHHTKFKNSIKKYQIKIL